MTHRLLIVDDEPDILGAITESLANFNLEIDVTQSPIQAIEWCEKQSYDIVITDYKMKPMTGTDLIEKIKAIAPKTEFVIITGFASYDSAITALKLGVFDYIEKPFSPEAIRLIIKNICQTLEIKDENTKLKTILINRDKEKPLIGVSPAFKQTLSTIQKAAPTDSTVLLLGESGTGKELLAKEIYLRSTRKNKPFITCNCAALPEQLIESELFGHESGAFTDAKKQRRGSFELADGGTIFLDEIGEMPLHIQTKLLRTLENREVKRLGSEQTHQIDIRIIAATNRNLKEMVHQKTFREDLFFRLNIITIQVQPLRNRTEDIPLLAEHFIQLAAQRVGKPAPTLEKETLKALTRYHWKGNTRELKNSIERVIILSDKSRLDLSCFNFLFDEQNASAESAIHQLPLMNLNELQEKYIRLVLERFNNNQSQTAKALGISTSTLWRHLKETE